MARYTYNEGLVVETLEKLNEACKTLDPTNAEIDRGITMILNARGAENMTIDFEPIKGYQSHVIEYIDTYEKEITSKAQEIEEFENAPWWKKVFATIGLGALKIIEGFIGVLENVMDGLVAIVGFVGGIFSSDFQDCLGEFIKTDWVGSTTAKWYTEGWLKGVNKYSYMSHESTAANILKGVGNAAGYIALSCIPYVGFAVSTATATVGAIGSGTQSGLQQGMSYNQAFGKGVKQGAVALATSLIAKGVANKLGGLGGAVDDAVGVASKTASKAQSTFSSVKAGLAGCGDDMAQLLDDAGQYLDDISGFADDAAMLGSAPGQATASSLNSANKLASTVDKIKSLASSKGITVSDDVMNGLDDMAAAANSAKTAGNLLANTTSMTHGKIGDTVKNIPGAKAVTTAASKVYQNPGVQKVVQGAAKVVQGASKVTPAATSMASTAAGVLASKQTDANYVSSQYREAQQLAGEIEQAATFRENTNQIREDATPTIATGDEIAANYQRLQEQGYNPGSGSPDVPVTDGGTITPSDVTTGTTYDTITANPVDIPDTPNTNTETITPNQVVIPEIDTPGGSTVTPPPSDTPNVDVPTDGSNIVPTTDIVGTTTPQPGNSTNGVVSTMIDSPVDENVETVSQDVLDTFGQASSSISGISQTNIPSSSSPILSSENRTQSKSMIPLGAGLGAAAVAGLGVKAAMDKREKDKEEKDNIATEEWTETDNMQIDYNQSYDDIESDYLSPTDDIAFQE